MSTSVLTPREVKHSSNPGVLLSTAGAVTVLGLALGLGGAIYLLQAGRPAEQAVMKTAVLIAGILALAPAIYFLRERHAARPATAGLLLLCASAVSLLGIYFYWVSSYVVFPADILIWSEGDFINDIVKYTIGYPMYSPQVNNDSINYVPLAQILTYHLGLLVGKDGSIPVYRGIQIGFAALAAFIALLCCRRILRLAFPESRAAESWLWNILWYAALMLVATNSITNHFAHNLHADSLAEAANLAAFYFLLRYIEKPSRSILAAMAVMGTVGFFVRQNALIWYVCYGTFLLIWGRSWKRLAGFTASAAAIFGVSLAICFKLWGEPFYYWVFYMLSQHAAAPLRSFQHGLDSWAYYAALLLGAAAVLRGKNASALLGAWLTCLFVFVVETYTSGIGWMLNHMGPGSLLAAVWFLAGLASVWNAANEAGAAPGLQQWIRAGAITATLALLFNGWGVIRIPLQPIPQDAYRYVHDIENEFQGLPSKRVLLDLGAWMHLKDRAVVGDRATSVGDRGYTGAGDFTGLMDRIATKYYAKIMVRGYHTFDFVYDYFLFPKPTGIRAALQNNYREVGSIRAVEANPYVKDWAEDPYYFGEITILEPRE